MCAAGIIGPQVNKFEQVFSDDYQMSEAGDVAPREKNIEQVPRSYVWRGGGGFRVSQRVGYPPPTPWTG